MSVSSITETSQYLTFKLDEEVFALDISNAQTLTLISWSLHRI